MLVTNKKNLVLNGQCKVLCHNNLSPFNNHKLSLISTANANSFANLLHTAEHLIGWSQGISVARILQKVTKTCYMLLACLHFIK